MIASYLNEVDPTEFDIWADLDALSTHTTIDDIEIDPAGIVLSGENFEGVFNVYVSLQYGTDNEEGFTTSDSFLARFSGHFDEANSPVIDKSEVDTSSFYADDEDS
ncbi:hypothetical protein A6768_24335 [Sphingobium yanoikuyae]|uniref:Predicted pPIWI-associating nuclease group 2 domain-containing protein n=1 Tax=Sphingobium yanoikuyae TaxID=13690 RepID=A0A291N653_SPHYA|nr:hypothetical protein A6768_24335 [Sphingobium yanoikuyae]